MKGVGELAMRLEEKRAWQRELLWIISLRSDCVREATAVERRPISEKDVFIRFWVYFKNDVLVNK